MSFSVNTNSSALVALENLSATASQLSQTQNIISTGFKVATAKDDGATWAIAQNSRATIAGLNSVTDSLNRANSTVDVAVSAGGQISDLLNQLKAKALAGSAADLDATSRASLNNDFTALRDQITTIVNNASFNGANLIDGSLTSGISPLANASGTGNLKVASESLALGGTINSLAATAHFSSAADALALVTSLSSVITNVNAAVAKLGTASNAISSQLTSVGNLQDSLTTGVSNLVDANLAKESATLQALQSKQQLGVQALSIANSSTSSILSLFR